MDRERVVFNYGHQGTARPVRKRPRCDKNDSETASDPRSRIPNPNDIPRPPPPPMLSRHHSSDSNSSGQLSPLRNSGIPVSPTRRSIPHPPPPPSISGRSGGSSGRGSQSPLDSPVRLEDPRVSRPSSQNRDRPLNRHPSGGNSSASSKTVEASSFRVPRPSAPLPSIDLFKDVVMEDDDDDDAASCASVDTSVTRPVINRRKPVAETSSGSRSEKSKNTTSGFQLPVIPFLNEDDDDNESIATIGTLKTVASSAASKNTSSNSAPYIVRAGELQSPPPISVPESRKRNLSGESTTSTVIVSSKNVQQQGKSDTKPPKYLLKNLLNKVLKKDSNPSKVDSPREKNTESPSKITKAAGTSSNNSIESPSKITKPASTSPNSSIEPSSKITKGSSSSNNNMEPPAKISKGGSPFDNMEPHTKPTLTKERKAIPRIDRSSLRKNNVREGRLLYLHVKISGEPTPNCSWAKDGQKIVESNDWRIENGPSTTKLFNDNPRRKDSGTYKITANNKWGEDTAEVEVLIFSKPGQPEGPLEVIDIKKDGCKLKWEKPIDDGGVPLDYYIVEKSDTEVKNWILIGKPQNTEFKVNNLICGSKYLFRVRSVNKEGESPVLETPAPILAKDPFTIPDKPGELEATDWSPDHVDLKWSAPISDGGAAIEGYIIEKKSEIFWEKAEETDGSTCTVTVKNLEEGQQYLFRVIARNKAGNSEPSYTTNSVTTKARFLSAKIVNPPVRGDLKLSTGRIMKFDMDITGEPPPTIVWMVGGNPLVAGNAVELDNSDYSSKLAIRPATRKHSGSYTITVTNSSGEDSRTINVIITDKPGQPEGTLDVSDVTDIGCKLKWTKPKDDGGCPVTYEIEKLNCATEMWTSAGTCKETEVDVDGLTKGASYKFRVRSVTEIGASEHLTTEEFIVARNPYHKPEPPKNIEIDNCGKDFVVLKWDVPDDDGGSPITSYVIEKHDKLTSDWEICVDVVFEENLTSGRVSSLTEGSHEFRVRAVNEAGPGEASELIQALCSSPAVEPMEINEPTETETSSIDNEPAAVTNVEENTTDTRTTSEQVITESPTTQESSRVTDIMEVQIISSSTSSTATAIITTSSSKPNEYPVLRIQEVSDVPENDENSDTPMVTIRKDLFSSPSSDGEDSVQENPDNLEVPESDRPRHEVINLRSKLHSKLSKKFAEIQGVIDRYSSTPSQANGIQIFRDQLKEMIEISTKQWKTLDKTLIRLSEVEKKEKPPSTLPSPDLLNSITVDQVAEYLKSLVVIEHVRNEPSSNTEPNDVLSFLAHRVLRILHYHYSDLQQRGREEGAAILSVDLMSKTLQNEVEPHWTNANVVRAWDRVRFFKGERDNDEIYRQAITWDHNKIGPAGFLKKVRAVVKQMQPTRPQNTCPTQIVGTPAITSLPSTTSSTTTVPILIGSNNILNRPTYRLSPVTPPSPVQMHQQQQHSANRMNVVFQPQNLEQSRMQPTGRFPSEHGGTSVGQPANSYQSVQISQQLSSNFQNYQQPQQRYIPSRQQSFPPTTNQSQQFAQQQQQQQQQVQQTQLQAGLSQQTQVRVIPEPVWRSQSELQQLARTVQAQTQHGQQTQNWTTTQQQHLITTQQQRQRIMQQQQLTMQHQNLQMRIQQQQQQAQVQNPQLRPSTLQHVQRPRSHPSDAVSTSGGVIVNPSPQQLYSSNFLPAASTLQSPILRNSFMQPNHSGQNATSHHRSNVSHHPSNLREPDETSHGDC